MPKCLVNVSWGGKWNPWGMMVSDHASVYTNVHIMFGIYEINIHLITKHFEP